MNFARNLAVLLVGASVALVKPQVALSLTPVEVNNIAQAVTVRIDGDGIGSGVIFERKGETYFVLTNRHVVSRDGRYEIHTQDDASYPVYYSKELPGLDLAVLQFNSKKNYPIASLGNSDQIKEGMTVYVVGWADRLPGIDERSYQFTNGSIRSRLKKPDEGYALVYNNEAIPGMSGGPVLDENGRLVGINGRATSPEEKTGTVLRLGIPINTFLAARNNLQPVTATPTTTTQKPDIKPNIATAGQSNTRERPTATRKQTAEDLISLGGAKADKGDYRGAIAYYNQALQLSPNNPDAYFRRGSAYNELKDYPAALKNFEQVIRLSPKNATAYAYRGLARFQLKDYKGALADGDKAISLNNDPKSRTSAFGYGVRGTANLVLNNHQQALADINKVVQLLPNQPEAYNLRGLVRVEMKDYKLAIADLQKAADLYLRQGKTAESQVALNELQNIPSTSQPATTSNPADPQTTIATANEAIARNPKDADAYFNRATAYYNRGDKQSALDDINQVVKLKPNYSLAWYNRGVVLSELGRNEVAIASYNRAIQINNQWGDIKLADAYLNRANIYNERGDSRRAIADYNQVLRLNPKNASAYVLRGMNHQRRGDNQAAIKDFNSAVRIDPNNAIAYLARGFGYHTQGDYQGALAAYEKATAQDAKLLPAVNNLGLIKYELQDMEGAIRQFQAAIEIDGKSAEPQLALATALYTKGDRQRAIELAQSSLRLDSRFADLEFLKKNIWGDRILADVQKLLQNPQVRQGLPSRR